MFNEPFFIRGVDAQMFLGAGNLNIVRAIIVIDLKANHVFGTGPLDTIGRAD